MALSGAVKSFSAPKSVYAEEGRGLLIWGGEDKKKKFDKYLNQSKP
jgi:hypothetical protein